MSDYEPKKSDRFAFGLWTIQNTGRDPFGEATRSEMTGLEVIRELGRRNVYSFEMHAEDLVPEGSSASERDRLIREAKKLMVDENILCTNCGANCHGHPVFKDGGVASNDPKIRQVALQRYLNAIDIAYEVGCRLCNLWWGRDGAEVDASKNPLDVFKRLRDTFNYLQAYLDKKGYKDFRLSMEPKPNEPRGDTYIPTVGHALGLIATLDKPGNCGVVPEVAHVRMAGLNAYHEIAMALECGKLFGLHFNSQKPLRYDQDLRFGAEDLKESFFVVKLVEDAGWPGTRSFDAHAYRTADREEVWDFVYGCMRSYLILKEKVQQFNADKEIQDILKELNADSKAALPPHDQLLKTNFDLNQLSRKKLHHERLDQLTQEIILGVR